MAGEAGKSLSVSGAAASVTWAISIAQAQDLKD
jgi:hypothetical protein